MTLHRCGKIFFLFILAMLFFIFRGTPSLAEEMRIAYVIIEGNHKVETEDILGEISKYVRGGEVLSDRNIDLAVKAVEDMGYFSSVITELQPSFMGYKVIFKVTEYPLLKEIVFTGLKKITSQDILQFIELKPGQVINTTNLSKDFYSNVHDKVLKRYGVFLLSKNIAVSTEGVITWEIVEAKLLDIKIEGLTRTKEVTVKRMLNSKIGELFDYATMMDDYQRLLNCKLFEEVIINIETPDIINNGIVVLLSFKELPPREISASIAVDEAGTVLGELTFNHNNLDGFGNRLSLNWIASSAKDNYSIALEVPWLNNKGTSLGFSLYNTSLKGLSRTDTWGVPPEATLPQPINERYDESRKGGIIRLSHPLNNRWRGLLDLKGEFYEEKPRYDFTGPNDEPAEYRSLQANSVKLGFEYNSVFRENPFYVKKGGLHRFEAEFAGDNTPLGIDLGGDVEYRRYLTELRQYFDVGKDQTFAVRLMGGKVYGQRDDLNIFYIGGSETLRGYYARSFSGSSMLLGNFEYRYQFSAGKKDEGSSFNMFEAVAFYDIGQTWGGTDSPESYKSGYGVGLRIYILGLGQLRLDYGWSEENSGLFSFSFGEMF